MNTYVGNTARAEQLLDFRGARRLPVILQTEVAECGLACLGMIAGFYGFETDMTSLRRRYSISSKGVNLRKVAEIAAHMHLAPRALRVEPENLSYVQLPCVVHWGLNHFVILKAIHKNSMEIHDPAFGHRKIDKDDFDKEFTGVVLELTPTKKFTKGENKQKLKLSDFWSNIVGLKRSLIQMLALSLLLQCFALASPYYMQTVVDDVLLRNDTNLLMVLSFGFGLLMLVQLGTNTLREFVILHLSNRLGMQMSANLFRHLIRLPMEYFEKRHMGDIVSRFGSLGSIRELITHSVVAALIDGIMAILTLIAMLFYSVKLTLIVISIVVIYGLIRWFFYRPFKMLNEETIIAAAKENSHFMESIRAIQTIKIFQRENDRQNQWQNRLAEVMNKNIRIANWQIGYGAINGFLFGLENLLVVYFAATEVMGSLMSLGMLYAFMSYKGRFVSSMDGLISKWVDLKMIDIQLNRLADIAFTQAEDIDMPSNLDEDDSVIDFEQASNKQKNEAGQRTIVGKIEVRNLAFRYSEHEPYVFKDINFVIHPGETVAIIGPSGCGKTTLLKCLMGLLEPSEGEIFIDDKPLDQILHYRSQIAGVMQDDQLLSGDIAENISCFAPTVDTEKVERCAQRACIHREIETMPMQYHTLVGDMGSSLSGGQKQRVILARALYREPRIMFMDEATSHLDVDNESMVSQHIGQLNITRVLVAHRPETVRSTGRQINLARRGDE